MNRFNVQILITFAVLWLVSAHAAVSLNKHAYNRGYRDGMGAPGKGVMQEYWEQQGVKNYLDGN